MFTFTPSCRLRWRRRTNALVIPPAPACPSPQVPPEMYALMPFALAPVLGNPINLLAAGVDSDAPVRQQAAQLVQSALALLQQLPRLADILPAGRAGWDRLGLGG